MGHKLARKIDRYGALSPLVADNFNVHYIGERTLTVRTKLDLMSTSTDLHQYLSRRSAEFNLLFVVDKKIM